MDEEHLEHVFASEQISQSGIIILHFIHFLLLGTDVSSYVPKIKYFNSKLRKRNLLPVSVVRTIAFTWI